MNSSFLRYFLFILMISLGILSCSKKKNPFKKEDSKSLDVTCADFAGCVNSPPLSVHPAMVVAAFPTLAAQLPGLRSDLDKIASSAGRYPLSIEDSPTDSTKFFASLFGGKSAGDVKAYLDLRMKYLMPPDVDIYDLSYSAQQRNVAADTSLSILAKNVGVLLWLSGFILNETVYTFVGSSKVVVTGSRVGIVQLGDSFWNYGNQDDGSKVSIGRLSTLVHEGRHSDCTQGLPKSVLDIFLSSSNLNSGNPLTALVENTQCGHLHATCPSSFPVELRGKAACDEKPWGAYATEMVFTQAVASHCESCGALEKQVALMATLDSKSRLIPVSGDSGVDQYQKMLSGAYGLPDMGSGGVVSP